MTTTIIFNLRLGANINYNFILDISVQIPCQIHVIDFKLHTSYTR